MSLKLNQENFESAVLNERLPVLVDFYSDSCVPCKRMSPILADLEEAYAGRLVIGKVNTLLQAELAEAYHIRSVPTLIFFKNGQTVERRNGVVSRQDLEKMMDNLLNEEQ